MATELESDKVEKADKTEKSELDKLRGPPKGWTPSERAGGFIVITACIICVIVSGGIISSLSMKKGFNDGVDFTTGVTDIKPDYMLTGGDIRQRSVYAYARQGMITPQKGNNEEVRWSKSGKRKEGFPERNGGVQQTQGSEYQGRPLIQREQFYQQESEENLPYMG